MGSIIDKFSGSTRRVTFGLSFIQFFKAFLSFFTVIISSAYFGTSLGRDIWLLSLSIVAILGAIIFGPVFEIFRAKFVMLKEGESEVEALKATGSLFIYMLIISIIVIITAEIIPVILGKTFAPTYTNEQHHILVIMIRLIAPTLFFSIINSILTGLLNVYNVFYVPELMSIFSSVLNVIIILIFAPKYGIYSLVLSGYLSNICLIIVLVAVIRRSKIQLFQYINLDFHYTINFFKFALPFYFNYFISQILLATERIISTFLGVGSISVLDYARKFVTIPISVIQGTVNVVLTATLAKLHIKEGERSFILEMNKFMDMMLLVTMPLITLFITCPVEIVRVFLLHGAFDPKFVDPTAHALFWFGFGIVSIIFYSTNVQALVAQGKIKITAIISGTLGFFVLAINLLFYKKYGIQVMAFSWSLGHFIAGVIMYFVISFSEIKLLFNEFLRKAAILFMTLILSCVIYNLMTKFLSLEESLFKSIVTIGVIGIVSILIELGFIYLLKFKEREVITRYLNAYVHK